MRAALIKGDAVGRTELARWLKEGGVSLAEFRSASAFLASPKRDSFGALLLDWAPTDMPGVAAAVRIRSACGMAMPIVFVGGPDAEEAIVCGLGCGADAYVAGPVWRLELLARIEAVVRRAACAAAERRALDTPPYRFDLAARTATLRGELLALTGLEFDLAVCFFRCVGQALSRRNLLGLVWGARGNTRTRTVDVHVCRLRARLALRPENGCLLSTVNGIGYRLEPAAPAERGGGCAVLSAAYCAGTNPGA